MRVSAIHWVSSALALLGIYFSYQGRRKGHGRLISFIFWFFLLGYIPDIIHFVQSLAMPANPSSEWLQQFSGFLNGIGWVRLAFSLAAVGILVYGCYDAQKPRSS